MRKQESNANVYQILFEQSTVPMFVLDSKYIIQEVNNSFEELLGYDNKTLQESSFETLFFRPEDFNIQVKSPLELNNEISISTSLKKSSELITTCNVDLKKISVDTTDNSGVLIGTISKITVADDSGQEALFNDRIATFRQIARSMGHEIRNPLTNLTLALDQLSEEVENEDSELYLNIINRNAHRIEKLVSDMLDATKASELNPTFEDINTLVSDWINSVPDELKLDIDTEVILANDLPKRNVDPDKLTIVLESVFSNAVKALEGRKNGRVKITTLFDEQDVIISIQDNGPGIEEEDIPRVFSPFFTGIKKWGSGLGLTQAKNIIHAHKGYIKLDTQLGKGSTFHILLRE